MNIELAIENDVPVILEILKQRCEWFKQNSIEYLRLDCMKTNKKLNEYYEIMDLRTKMKVKNHTLTNYGKGK